MSVTLDATLAGASSNSYITVATATAYFDNRLDTTDWTSASADNKAASLITATTWLESLDYYGTRATTTQSLKWPRIDWTCDSVEIDATAIPRDVQAATAETALALLKNPDLMRASTTGPGPYDRIELGDLKVNYRSTSAVKSVNSIIDLLPWLASYLRCWSPNARSSAGAIRIYRT